MAESTDAGALRSLPSIDELLRRPQVAKWLAEHPRPRVLAALRLAVQAARERILAGGKATVDDEALAQALARVSRPNLRKVLNATGVVLHTNLGRAPLAPQALERIREVAGGYCNLEYDLEEGERGSRYAPVVGLLRELTGAEDALVVNNGAAAVLLALTALGQGREAIVSRGELVEIGGGFRIPDVMRQSGVQLVEVGTTNRTRLADYEAALTPQTALLLKVHRSNFALVGFTEEADTRALSGLARARGLPLFEDLGSGLLEPLAGDGLAWEPTVRSVLSAGADLTAFSGDKLLGGPQAGIVVGKARFVSVLRQHPLNRALRVDKLTVAALEATLELYRDERFEALPAHRLLTQSAAQLEARAQALLAELTRRGVSARVEPTRSQVGGGAMPLASPQSFGCALSFSSPRLLQDKLREVEPPVIARIVEDQLLLDVRCLADDELAVAAAAVSSVLQELTC